MSDSPVEEPLVVVLDRALAEPQPLEVEDGHAAVQAARDAVATLLQARRHGCVAARGSRDRRREGAPRPPLAAAEILRRLERRARIAVEALEDRPERAELEEALARVAHDADDEDGEVEVEHEEEPMTEEATVENETTTTTEPAMRPRGRPRKIPSETSAPEIAPTRGSRRRRASRPTRSSVTRRVPCPRCGRRICDGPAAQARHAQRCAAVPMASPTTTRATSSPPAVRSGGATPEEALARCREALAPFAPEVRRLTLDLLVATT